MTFEALEKQLPYIHLLENEIQIEDDISNYLTIALKVTNKNRYLKAFFSGNPSKLGSNI